MWRVNCHMDAMCSARAWALIQDLTSVDVKNEEKYGKIETTYRCLWQTHDTALAQLWVLIQFLSQNIFPHTH